MRSQSHQAFHQLLDSLRDYADICLGDGTLREIDQLDGFRNILHLLCVGADCYLEGDPERPAFVVMTSPTRKWMGDNPDCYSYFAPIRGDRAYRIRGRRAGEKYLSFSIHGRVAADRLGPSAEPLLADISDRQLQFDADGGYEIILSRDPCPGNWIRLPDNAASVISRHIYEDSRPALANPDIRISLSIEPLEPPPPRPMADDASFARKLRDVNAFIRGATFDMLTPSGQPAFTLLPPNEMPAPIVFRASGSGGWGGGDIAYAMGVYRLRADEALVMEGRFPDCSFVNVMLWNRYMQTLEYRDRQISLNRSQLQLEPDGSYRIVLAARDPGCANWLDTCGREEGLIFWRMLLPAEDPPKPRCRVVPISDLN
ncbi:hypothetical protein B9N43_11500 [Denitratisoma sp. DHT3]|uniref:DUF1214 domain-containing protein n=1 Tax=Denitratisoma sp. DHT3 TaxID=1981880 RepID=UPI001198C0B0|nr:DUF1214 domain-containing protein [Denitratisoma sp. DHT3]QDX81819.1 hypothetical protein B9N43_11500 [Denitratisoma sp. DHT3]